MFQFIIVSCSPIGNSEKELKDTYYIAIWNQCLTDVVFDHSEYTDIEITQTCRERLQLALDNKFYENRQSDMFQPIPSDIYKLGE